MAITIRDTEQHQDMLDQIKTLTKQTTMSGALIKAGYAAIKYNELSERQSKEIQALYAELRQLKSKITTFNNALENLKL
ncbi:hypothetical protein MD535_08160 [Vibrio sp. ZSDZ65]|uniref:Uncharacterized protein n=1 Tax=Vibrio qingdaonensis TaxID=2829491 RepID=A0A9X3HVV9_9VIBR|nr:hypothetical protein [Vibrio qingdaonensis]MCW8345980.1 hypothetical protein [Vibrio qingdaonensis]